MAIFSLTFLGIAPLGHPAVGSLTHAVSIRPALVVFGVLAVGAGLLYGQRLRRVGAISDGNV